MIPTDEGEAAIVAAAYAICCEIYGPSKCTELDEHELAMARAAIAAYLAALPGWRLVPVKATREMTIIAEAMGAGEAWAEDCWSAMQASSPPAPGLGLKP